MLRIHKRGSAGQAAVETAIVLPLFTFMILGIMQITLVYQARAMLKYAAYRAARAGALNNACEDKMREAALAVLLPVIAHGDSYLRTQSAGQYIQSLMRVKFLNRYLPLGPEIINVRICGPLKDWVTTNATYKPGSDQKEVDFDDSRNVSAAAITGGNPAPPNNGAAQVRGFHRTKLRVQVKYNFHMVIPLANMVIFKAWSGQRLVNHIPEVMRMDKGGRAPANDKGASGRPDAEDPWVLNALAMSGKFYLPIYANYAFRMQSNFFTRTCPLPQKNNCWHYKDGEVGKP